MSTPTEMTAASRLVPDELYSQDPEKVRARAVELVAKALWQHVSLDEAQVASERTVPHYVAPRVKRRVELALGWYAEHDGKYFVVFAQQGDERVRYMSAAEVAVRCCGSGQDRDVLHAELMALKANPDEHAAPIQPTMPVGLSDAECWLVAKDILDAKSNNGGGPVSRASYIAIVRGYLEHADSLLATRAPVPELTDSQLANVYYALGHSALCAR